MLGSGILEPQNIRFTSKQLSTLRHPWCVQKAAPLACLALAALSACSRQKPISQIELQSKLRSAASIAAEAGTFIDYIGQNRATDQYAKGHVEYLSSELTHRAKDSREALPPAGARHNRGCSSGFLNFSNHSGLPDWLKMESLARRCSFVVSLGGVAKCVPRNADRKSRVPEVGIAGPRTERGPAFLHPVEDGSY